MNLLNNAKKYSGMTFNTKQLLKDGQVFKTKGWRDDKVGINQRQLTSAYREAKKILTLLNAGV